MTKKEALKEFRQEIMPFVRYAYDQNGVINKPARLEAWNVFTDNLCKLGEITIHQYETWVGPF